MPGVIKYFLLLFLFIVSGGCQKGMMSMTDEELQAAAEKLAREMLIVDTHQDVPYRLQGSDEDVSRRTEEGHFDYPRAIEGGLNALFMAAYVPARYEESGGAKAFADEGIDIVRNLAEEHPEKFVLVRFLMSVFLQLMLCPPYFR